MTVTVAGITENLRTDTTDPWTWSSFNAASPQGVVVMIAHGTESTDLVVSVSYGSKVLTRVCTATDTATEPGRSYIYFAGEGIPTGVQTISVDLASGTTTDILGVAYSLDGDANLVVVDSDTRNDNAAADPTVLTLQYNGRSSMAFGVCYSGVTANTTLTVNTTTFPSTKDGTTDLAGNFTAGVQHQTTAGTADFSIQWGGVGTDDLAFSAAAVTEVGTQTHRLPLITKIIAVSSLAAMLAQPIPNLNATTLKPAVAHSLNLEAGSYSLTGADLTTLAGRSLNLEAGTYVITGADLTPLAGRALDLEAGTYATTGADLTVAAGRSLDLEAGTYATTGADLTALADRTLNLEASSYTITGADLTFVYVPSSQAPFSQTDWRNPQRRVTFHQPSMYRPAEAATAQATDNPFVTQEWPNPTPRPLNLAAYGYTVRLPEKQKPFLQHDWPNPYSKIRIAYRPPTMFRPDKPALNAYSLDLEAGSYVLSGAEATLDHSGTPTAYDLNLEAGTYVVTGADLTTLADRTLDLEAGTYAITGADLTALVARALNLEPGTYTITGAAATLQGPLAISDGDEVQVLIAPDGIACTVLTDSGTTVKVVISSAKQIHVLTTGGAPIKVII